MKMNGTPPVDKENSTQPDASRDEAWAQIHDALRGLQFGTVSIVVQDGVVVQIDRTEKRRIRRTSPRCS